MQKIISKLQLTTKIIENLRNMEKNKAILEYFRNTVVYYNDPTDPVGQEDWEAI